MKFGYIQEAASVDYTLPSAEVLIPTHAQTETQSVHIGGSKWGIKQWVGNVYPKGSRASDYLYHYSRAFDTIELNASGYGLRMLDSIEKWIEQVPEQFTFSPKFPRTVSHYRKLTGPGIDSAHSFMDRITDFEGHLGMPFLQMNERFAPDDFDSLIDFVEQTSQLGRYAIELRNAGWFTDVHSETAQLLSQYGLSWVITDTPGRRDVVHSTITSKTLFIRFAAAVDPAIDHERLNSWAHRIKQLKKDGVATIYIYIHCMDPALVPGYVHHLRSALGPDDC